jgi:hypothetical protein
MPNAYFLLNLITLGDFMLSPTKAVKLSTMLGRLASVSGN